jgi:phage gpG-like protein
MATPEAVTQIIIDRLSNVKGALPEIAEVVRFSIDENFEKEGRYNGSQSGINLLSGGGTKWRKLAASTVRQREKKGYTPINILRRTGILASSITVQPAGNNAITAGTNVGYAAFNNFGTRKMPARPFLVLQQEDLQDFQDIIADNAAKQFK